MIPRALVKRGSRCKDDTASASEIARLTGMKRLGALVFFVAASASADPIAWSPPDKCPDGFTCGALSARLAAHDGDWPGAFVAAKRACAFDALFCQDYAQLYVSVSSQHGGDAQKGIAMLEDLCKKDHTVCTTLARDYDNPPRESGLARDAQKAERIYIQECDGGDFLTCSSLGRLYLKQGDIVKARFAMEKGCAGNDHYAAGVCSTIATELVAGSFGSRDAKGAIPYLEKSCTQGYRCDLGVELLTSGKDMPPDLDKAKKMARTSCERFYCGPMEVIAKKDPAWAKAQLTELCARKNSDACRRIARP
jgi:TPR repeat protein